MQAAGGIDDDHVHIAGLGGGHGIKGHRCGIGLVLLHDIYAHALRPMVSCWVVAAR